ncbi:MAG TPA: pyridine nucleotide-disulfide oxidoreductase [Sphaerochaeta sp.]|jgi:NADPH-dependent 2,4-dienoyl-CoA reductase/sulfur reductase-like enzyme|nr:MAG: pyridine nucleotide-disulfide oxidoreductase [Spirochaetes bacterium GWC2_52_13]PKL12403.1 MAG: pyridine nucleotide-disulfide oxidoreductase [Spirochaetae bacterium HGW-Spirochaetae-8]PKL22385.1 MAG: pyridine nucleotide-disulfide oxidoreductase [Spirochaetae bacterium HGW-Spirochaetae-4]HCG62465.1 pyridine nucleotide-disulfide oxidoreductase [Sphaerochaeta sp.]HCJ94882.1 pyridine nucleotide-disulfide oxidoreductase [Sphaerochaeta sp.]
MRKVDVLVVGGGASGLQAAITTKSTYPEKEVVLVRKEQQVLIPCGIPYIFGTLNGTDQDILSDKLLTSVGVEIVIDEIVDIKVDEHACHTKEGEVFIYGKLILALGSIPTRPKWLKGAELDNVFTIPKNKVYLDAMIKKISSTKRIVVIGAGFIGVEVSDELNKKDFEVTLVEIEKTILSKAFDEEFGKIAEEHLRERGVNLVVGEGVAEISGKDGKVAGIILSSGKKIPADAVVLSMGYVPNTEVAAKAQIELNEFGFIRTCEYMRVLPCSNDIVAVGDCAEKRDFVTRKLDRTMLASTACAEARTAGMNLYTLSPCKPFTGTIAIYSTAIGDHAFGTAGITEARAIQEDFAIISGSFTGMDTHPGNLSHSHKQTVKLIVAADCGMILGGEVYGGFSTGELTNAIGFLIQNRVTVKALLTMQIGTQPLLTGSPAGYPLIKAAEVIVKKMRL